MTRIQLPANGWRPRPYQQDAWSALEGGCKRVYLVWHRRGGKDDVPLRWTSQQMFLRPGVYWHMLPYAEQARDAIWTAVNPHTGMTRIDETFPPEIRSATRNDRMEIEVEGPRGKSLWKVVGSDSFDRKVGTPPVGLTFSEWALADPAAWAYFRPILLENGGWAIFNTTPRGDNHAFDMFEEYREDPDWFVQMLTADDTGVFSEEDLRKEKRAYIADWGKEVGTALFRQEYMCSFDAPIIGAYYAPTLEELDKKGGVTKCPHDPGGQPVVVSFDLGMGDQTALWFAQQVGREARILDYYAASGVELGHYIEEILKRFRREQISTLIVPHDANQRARQTGITDEQFFRNNGFDVTYAPRPKNNDEMMQHINAVRRFLPRCVFDREKTLEGRKCLRQYRAERDDKHKVLKLKPLHDWASHGADSFRTLVMGWDKAMAIRSGYAPGSAPTFQRRRLGSVV